MMKDRWNLDGSKLLWHMDRVHKHFVQGKRIAPIMIDMGITKCCNIKCEFCYGIFQNMNGAMIPREPLIQLFKDAPKVGIKAIAIVGDGEPTLNPAFVDAIKAGAEGGLDMAVATNGVKISTQELTDVLARTVWFRFNLSAIGDSYKIVHGVDKWDAVRSNILDAVAIRRNFNFPVTIGLQMVLTKNALSSVIPEAEFAITAGVDYFVVKQFSDPKCDGMKGAEMDWFDTPEVQAILAQAEAMTTPKTLIKVKRNAMAMRIRRPYDHCLDVPLLFQISGDGKCYPCGYLFGGERYCYGDITKQSIGEILASEHYWSIVKTMQTTFDVHKECLGCCRHDSSNFFMHNFVNRPEHLNFI